MFGHRKEIRVPTFRALVLRDGANRFALTKGKRLKRQHSNFFTVAKLPLVNKSVNKTKHFLETLSQMLHLILLFKVRRNEFTNI